MRALPLILLLACGASAVAQNPPDAKPPEASPAPPPSAVPAPAAPSPPPIVPLAGEWAGSARYKTEGAGACSYSGPDAPAAVKLQISVAGETGSGRLVLQLPVAAGPSCPAIHERASIKEMKLSVSSVSFRDRQGREWNLAVKEGVLQGIFAGPSGSGEVALRKTATVLGGAGLGSGALGIVAANVIGLGALVGINKVAQDDTTGTGAFNCSPRFCEVSGNECNCNTNNVGGGSCGQTPSGRALNEACSGPETDPQFPCQASLSCNEGVCQELFLPLGACPLP